MRFARVSMAVLLVAGCLLSTPVSSQTGKPSVHLDLNQEFLYAGDPLWVRITVRNDAAAATTNPVSTPLHKGFKVSKLGGAGITASGKAKSRNGPRSCPRGRSMAR